MPGSAVTHHVAALRAGFSQRLFNRYGNRVRLRILRLRPQSLDFGLRILRESREHVFDDVAVVVTGFDDADLNPAGGELDEPVNP